MKIKKITSLEILDSRGFPTLKTFVELSDGTVSWAAIPSGASTGSHEACELRDQDQKRYLGKGVLDAVYNVESILNDLLVDLEAEDQAKIDRKMIEADGTPNKTKLGANAILSVSLAVARAAAASRKTELYQYLAHFFNTQKIIIPCPLINVINGGKHADNSTDIQEYMLVPYGFPKFSEALRASSEVFQQLKKILKKKGQSTAVGDEGGFVPKFENNEQPLQILVDAITEAGYVPGEEFGLALDSAASEFFQNGKYNFKKENKLFSPSELITYYSSLITKYPLVSFEDHFAEDDWQGFLDFGKKLGKKVQTIGDDLYVTNSERLKKGIAMRATNSILIKPNQIGTLSETIEVIKMAKAAKMQAVVSHRSGETEDSFIADLAVAAGTGQLKSGSVCRSERLAKYNRLLEIESKEENSEYFNFPYKIQ